MLLHIDLIDAGSYGGVRRAAIYYSLCRSVAVMRSDGLLDGKNARVGLFDSVEHWSIDMERKEKRALQILVLHAPNTDDWESAVREIGAIQKNAWLFTYTGGADADLSVDHMAPEVCGWWKHFSGIHDVGDLRGNGLSLEEAVLMAGQVGWNLDREISQILGVPSENRPSNRTIDKRSTIISQRSWEQSQHALINALEPLHLMLREAHERDAPLMPSRVNEIWRQLQKRLAGPPESLPEWVSGVLRLTKEHLDGEMEIVSQGRGCGDVSTALLLVGGLLSLVLVQPRKTEEFEEIRAAVAEVAGNGRLRVMWIEDDAAWSIAMTDYFKTVGVDLTFVSEAYQLAEHLSEVSEFDAILVDLELRGFQDAVESALLQWGMAALELRHEEFLGLDIISLVYETVAHPPPAIVLSANSSPWTMREAKRRGASGYFVKGRTDYIGLVTYLMSVMEEVRLRQANVAVPRNPAILTGGEEDPLTGVLIQIARITSLSTEGPILLIGEPGVGKELLAKEIHMRARRDRGPRVVLDCLAIPQNLIESHLFGHAKGAFTDAKEHRIGALEEAGEGTLFLDEVDKLDPEVQSKLLGVLGRREFCRVGETTTRKFRALLIVASNSDPRHEGTNFIPAFVRRITRFPIRIPSLRERHSVAGMLAARLLARISTEDYGLPEMTLSADGQNWICGKAVEGVFDGVRGNVGGLETLLHSAIVYRKVGSSRRIEQKDLEGAFSFIGGITESRLHGDGPYPVMAAIFAEYLEAGGKESLRRAETLFRAALYAHLLEDLGKPKGEIASLLGVSPSGLSNDLGRLKRQGLLKDGL